MYIDVSLKKVIGLLWDSVPLSSYFKVNKPKDLKISEI